jgi:hypothetical protein
MEKDEKIIQIDNGNCLTNLGNIYQIMHYILIKETNEVVKLKDIPAEHRHGSSVSDYRYEVLNDKQYLEKVILGDNT